MVSMTRVSIIIPTYNRARFLGDAVASALAQTYRDFEIIIVDDGSTDNTGELVTQYPPEVRYFRQANRGVSAARNKGIELARGEYLCFLDSDDRLLPDALQKNVSFLDRHPEVGYCYGQIERIDENGRKLRMQKARGASKNCVRDGTEQISRLLFRGDISILTVLTRRSRLLEAGLFDTGLTIGEDIDMWLRLAMRYPVGYLAEPLGQVRAHPHNSQTQGGFLALEKSQTAFVQRALECLKTTAAFQRLRKEAYYALYCYLSGEAAKKGSRIIGLRYALKALKAYPGLVLHWEGFSFLLTAARGFLPKEVISAGKQTMTVLKIR
jgi:glycosyltransferase involved in cell wall biosynthesis